MSDVPAARDDNEMQGSANGHVEPSTQSESKQGKPQSIQCTLADVLDNASLTHAHWRIWLLCAMGIFLDGFDLFVIAVALPLISQEWSIDQWTLGMIGAAAPLGAMVGAATLGPLTDKLGRKTMYLIDLAIFIVFSVLCGFSWNPIALAVFRFLLGIGVGADYPISSAYIAEFMPARIRGKMLAGAFSFQALGALSGALVGLVVLAVYPDVSAWRFILASGAIPALVILALRHSAPESPRWLLSEGREDEARAVIADVAGAQASAASNHLPTKKSKVPISVLWSRPYLRRTVLALVPWFLLDVALYAVGTFTPTIIGSFAAANHGGSGVVVTTHHSVAKQLIASDILATEGAIVLDLFLVVGFVISIALVERVGRMRLQQVGFLGMTVGLLILSVSDLVPKDEGHRWFVFAGFAIFNLLVNLGPNATTYLLAAELFPTNLRATGHGLASAAGKVGAVVGIFLLPVVLASLGLGTTMALAAGVGILGFLVTWVFGIETAGASLESTGSAH